VRRSSDLVLISRGSDSTETDVELGLPHHTETT